MSKLRSQRVRLHPRCEGHHKLAECTVPRDNPKCVNCHGAHAASYKGCSKYQDELSSNRPITVRYLPKILTAATQIVADAVIYAKTTRYTDFDLSEFRKECKKKTPTTFPFYSASSSQRLLNPTSTTLQTATCHPLINTTTTATNDNNY